MQTETKHNQKSKERKIHQNKIIHVQSL